MSKWLLPSREGSHCPSIIWVIPSTNQRGLKIRTKGYHFLGESRKPANIEEASSVQRSKKRPMSRRLSGCEDATFPLRRRLRPSSKLNGDRRKTSHQRVRSCFKITQRFPTKPTPRIFSSLASLNGVCPFRAAEISPAWNGARSVRILPVLWRQRSGALWLDPCALSRDVRANQCSVNQRHSAVSTTALVPFLTGVLMFDRFHRKLLPSMVPALLYQYSNIEHTLYL